MPRGGRGTSSCFGGDLGLAVLFCVVLLVVPLLGVADFFSGGVAGSGRAVSAGADAKASAGAAATGGTLASPLRCKTKSSARPGGALTGSPLTKTRVAMASPCGELLPAPPSNSSELLGVTVKGTTGPATGRAAGLPSGTAGASGPDGKATGVARLFMYRRISRST